VASAAADLAMQLGSNKLLWLSPTNAKLMLPAREQPSCRRCSPTKIWQLVQLDTSTSLE
jgi:hypothetical protein